MNFACEGAPTNGEMCPLFVLCDIYEEWRKDVWMLGEDVIKVII